MKRISTKTANRRGSYGGDSGKIKAGINALGEKVQRRDNKVNVTGPFAIAKLHAFDPLGLGEDGGVPLWPMEVPRSL